MAEHRTCACSEPDARRRFSLFRKSIRNKLIAILLAAVIVPLSTSIFVTYGYTKRAVTEDRIRSTSALLFQGRENIKHYMETINQTSLSVYNDASFNLILQTGATDYISEQETYRALVHMANVMPDIYQIYLYMNRANQPYLMINGLFKRFPVESSPYRPDLGGGEIVIEPPHMSGTYGYSPTPYINPTVVMTLHRSIRLVPVAEEIGTLSVDVDMKGLAAMCDTLYEHGSEQLYVLDEAGRIFYGPDQELWGQRPEGSWVSELLARPEPSGSVAWDGDGFRGVQVYDRLQTGYLNWTIVKRIPDDVLYREARDLARINTFVLVAFALLSVVVTVGAAVLFTAPIKRLLGYISQIQKGNMNVDIDMKRNDEFGILAARFRSMMQHINNLIVEEYRLELANRTNQLKALQAQIQPHFLYNALQSIGTLALHMNAPNIYKLISSLGKMMRYSMNTAETIVPLAKEIDHIRAYVELQRHRFDGKVVLTVETDERSLDAPVPKMTLQPLVENYFKHGFDPSSETDGSIVVRSERLTDGSTLVSVADNGKGIRPERLDEMRRLLRRAGLGSDTDAEDPGGAGIGLLNVLSRLKLTFGDDAKMRIEVLKPHGFQVTLTIPPNRNEA